MQKAKLVPARDQLVAAFSRASLIAWDCSVTAFQDMPGRDRAFGVPDSAAHRNMGSSKRSTTSLACPSMTVRGSGNAGTCLPRR